MAITAKTGKLGQGMTFPLRDGQSGAGMVPMFLGRRLAAPKPVEQSA